MRRLGSSFLTISISKTPTLASDFTADGKTNRAAVSARVLSQNFFFGKGGKRGRRGVRRPVVHRGRSVVLWGGRDEIYDHGLWKMIGRERERTEDWGGQTEQ